MDADVIIRGTVLGRSGKQQYLDTVSKCAAQHKLLETESSDATVKRRRQKSKITLREKGRGRPCETKSYMLRNTHIYTYTYIYIMVFTSETGKSCIVQCIQKKFASQMENFSSQPECEQTWGKRPNAAKSRILNDDPNSLEQARISTRDGNTNVTHILIKNANEVHCVGRGAGFITEQWGIDTEIWRKDTSRSFTSNSSKAAMWNWGNLGFSPLHTSAREDQWHPLDFAVRNYWTWNTTGNTWVQYTWHLWGVSMWRPWQVAVRNNNMTIL